MHRNQPHHKDEANFRTHAVSVTLFFTLSECVLHFLNVPLKPKLQSNGSDQPGNGTRRLRTNLFTL